MEHLKKTIEVLAFRYSFRNEFYEYMPEYFDALEEAIEATQMKINLMEALKDFKIKHGREDQITAGEAADLIEYILGGNELKVKAVLRKEPTEPHFTRKVEASPAPQKEPKEETKKETVDRGAFLDKRATKELPGTMPELERDANEAARLHMSYGQYKAMKRREWENRHGFGHEGIR